VIIRKTTASDLDEVCLIYADARDFMRESGNPDQWRGSHPRRETIEDDIADGHSYVCVREGAIAAVFYFNIEFDPTYGRIDGQWLNDKPYGVVHRIARAGSAAGKGAGAFCIEWCLDRCGNLRIDTHRDNAHMIGLLEKLGFSYCGIIWLEDGDERRAFQKSDAKDAVARGGKGGHT